VEFDAAWAKAQRTLQRPDAAPALSECRYSATLEGDDLVGSATWRWHAPDKHAAPLRIASWSAAFRGQPTWEDGKPADIAPTGDLGLVLRPPPAGGDTLRFDWSLAGQKRGQERRFRLRLPAAPVAVLEITLPAALQLSGAGNRQSIVCTEQSVSERKWRVLPAAAIDADLLLSVLPEEAGAARPDAVRLRSHYALEPAGGLVRIQMEWTDRPRVKELCFDVDPELHIQEVLNQQVEWQPLPWRAAPGPPRQLYVTVPDGAEGPLLLEIRGYLLPASAPDDAALTLGGMRPSGLSCFSESIQVTTPPGFTLHPAGAPSDWPAPRLEKTAAGTQEVWSLAPEQSCRLMSRPGWRTYRDSRAAGDALATARRGPSAERTGDLVGAARPNVLPSL
jgi:hypothetical protein